MKVLKKDNNLKKLFLINSHKNKGYKFVTKIFDYSLFKNQKKKIIFLKNTYENHFIKKSLFGIKYANEFSDQGQGKENNKNESNIKINNQSNVEEINSFSNVDGKHITRNSFNYNDIDKDEIKFSENPYLTKQDIIKSDKLEKEKYNLSVNLYMEKMENRHMENLDVYELLDIISKMLKAENHDPNLWYKLLNQFNELLCNHQVTKKDILNFLELLNFFKPKILEKKILPKEFTHIGSQILFSKRHEEEYYKLTQPKDIFGQFALHLKKNLNSNVFAKFFDLKSKFENRENLEENIDDLLGLYSTLFKNIEQKIVDDIAIGRAPYSYNDSVTFIKSFACAQEGSNMLYELLMRKIIKHFNDLTLEDLEIILNYLPHELYNNKEFSLENANTEEKYVEMGRTKSVSEFYSNVYEKVIRLIPQAHNDLFLNLFQGCLRIKFIDVDVIGNFLLDFDRRLAENIVIEKEEGNSLKKHEISKINKKFVLDFLQILTYFIRNDVEEKFVELIEFEILWNSLLENFFIKNFENFCLKEICTIFWMIYHFRSVTNEKIKFFEDPIKKILVGYINDPKSEIDTMGYETNVRYYDNYKIDPYDVEALKFFIESNKNYKGELLNLFQKTLKCISLENTHPISRSLFKF